MNHGELSEACFSDSSAQFRVVLSPVSGEKEYVEKSQNVVRSQYHQWITRIAQRGNLSPKEFKLLQQIRIEVRFDRNSLGSIVGTNMTIDEGNLLVGYAFAYATAKVTLKQVSAESYTTWHDYFLDSIVGGDPIVYVDGAENFQKFWMSAGGLDQALRETFLATFYSWIALTVLHEAAHALLGHPNRWRQTFPEISGVPVDMWKPQHFAFSRTLELEADKKAVDLYREAGYTPTSNAISSWITWQLARREALSKPHIVIYPTHPEPEERAASLLMHIGKLDELPPSEREEHMDYINTTSAYIRGYTQKIRAGLLQPLPNMRGKRPAGMTPSLQRHMLRDLQLRLFAEKYAASQ